MNLKYILPILFIALITSCSNDNEDNNTVNEVEDLIKVQEFVNTDHTIELYTESGEFTTGYNAISFRIKNNATDDFIETANVSWMPMMQMPTMQHSCPRSGIVKTDGKNTVWEGFIVFQMTGENGSGWSIKFMYTINGQEYEIEKTITVNQSDMQKVAVFMGSDDTRYVLALKEPKDPSIAINDMTAGLYKMETMMSFPVVENYTITLDPRMPGMGNHSSPNNTDLIYNANDQLYHGDLSLTMTGYWVLNLKLMDDTDTVLKGEDVTEDNERSSLYLELEF